MNNSEITVLLDKVETNEELSASESLQLVLLNLLKAVTELETVDKFLNEAASGTPSEKTVSELRLEAINETIDLLAIIYPYLKDLQRETAHLEVCALFNVDPETGLDTLVKN